MDKWWVNDILCIFILLHIPFNFKQDEMGSEGAPTRSNSKSQQLHIELSRIHLALRNQPLQAPLSSHMGPGLPESATPSSPPLQARENNCQARPGKSWQARSVSRVEGRPPSRPAPDSNRGLDWLNQPLQAPPAGNNMRPGLSESATSSPPAAT